jgi:transcription termination factor NusA
VPDDQLSLAIGRRGQNVRLASQLTGWDIDIMTEDEESDRRQKEFAERSQLFMDALNVDEVVGQLLASEGFATVEEVAYVERDEISDDRGLSTTKPPTSFRRVRANIWKSWKPSSMRSASNWAWKTTLRRSTADDADAGGARQGRVKTIEDLPAAPPTIWSAGPNARMASGSLRRRSVGFRCVEDRCRSDDHAGARCRRLDHR